MDGQARFFLSSPDQSISTDALGLWQMEGFEDFYAIDDRPGDSIMWEVDLPGDGAASKWFMNERLASLRLTQDALPVASSLFQDYIRVEQDPESVDYGIDSSTVVEGSAALQELSRWMMLSGTDADYSVTEDIEEKLRSAFEELEAY